MGKAFIDDMQEPIRKLTFFSNALLHPRDSHTSNGRVLHAIEKSARRLRKLISSLLEFVNIRVLDEKKSLLSLRELIERALAQVAFEIGFTDLKVFISDEITFEGRKQALQTVFTELVKNAVKNRDPSRRLSIIIHTAVIKENAYQGSAGKYKYIDHVQIHISDNGQGFDKQYCSYVFGVLNKVNLSTNDVGLGLAMCRQLISYHFGRITADSTPGRGATFTIILPLSQHT